MPLTVILLAAGKGSRFSPRARKILSLLQGKPLFAYSFRAFVRHPAVSEIVVVANRLLETELRKITRALNRGKKIKFALGGSRRQDSVFNGLRAAEEETGLIFIHDAARPFVSGAVMDRLISAVAKYGAAVPAVPLKATIKEISSAGGILKVRRTPDRDIFREIQTPQAFKTELIRDAYAKFGRRGDFTDDASLLEKMGKTVAVVEGEYTNIKITTPDDMIAAEAICRMQKTGGREKPEGRKT